MNQRLAKYLSAIRLVSRDTEEWAGSIRLEIAGYLTPEVPPTEFVQSARAIVLDDSRRVLVMHNADGVHILPGGRVEPGETLGETLRRELLEEAGLEIRLGPQVGVIHLRHITPKPQGYTYLYPDFLWSINLAFLNRKAAGARDPDDYEVDHRFMPVQDAIGFLETEYELAFLSAVMSVTKSRA